MTRDQKNQITKNIHAINEMDNGKLCLFVQELYMLKPNMDEIVFKFTMRGADIHAHNIRHNTTVTAMVVLSELKEGEV